MTNECAYCGNDVYRHDPVFVETLVDGEREPAGQFCNYACLSAHVEAENLTAGASCEFDPTEESDA